MRRQFKKQPRVGKSVDDLYRLDRYERMKLDWINARDAAGGFSVQEYEAAMRDFARKCGI